MGNIVTPQQPERLFQSELQQQAARDVKELTIQAMLSTGRIHHLAVRPVTLSATATERQIPTTLPGPPVSEILIA